MYDLVKDIYTEVRGKDRRERSDGCLGQGLLGVTILRKSSTEIDIAVFVFWEFMIYMDGCLRGSG